MARGRPTKQGIDFFSMSVDITSDPKVKRIIMSFGFKGFGVLSSLLCEIYRTGYYLQYDKNETAQEIAFSVGDANQHGIVTNVVYELLKRGFFDGSIFERFGFLTSAGIQKRFLRAAAERRELEIIDELWLLDIPQSTKKRKVTVIPLDKSIIRPNKSIIPPNNEQSMEETSVFPLDDLINCSDKSIIRPNKSIIRPNNGHSKGEERKDKYSPIGEYSAPDGRDADEDTPREKVREPKIDYKALAETFNSTCLSLPKIQEITEKRRKKIRTFLKNYGDDKRKLMELFRKTEASDYLTGRDGKWAGCSFDWIINYNNSVKILEGNYDNDRHHNSGDKKDTSAKKSRICNFTQRDWDYDKIERIEQESLIQNIESGGVNGQEFNLSGEGFYCLKNEVVEEQTKKEPCTSTQRKSGR